MAMGDGCLAEQRLPPTGGRGCAAIAVTADCPLLGAAPFANAPRRTPQLPLGSSQHGGLDEASSPCRSACADSSPQRPPLGATRHPNSLWCIRGPLTPVTKEAWLTQRGSVRGFIYEGVWCWFHTRPSSSGGLSIQVGPHSLRGITPSTTEKAGGQGANPACRRVSVPAGARRPGFSWAEWPGGRGGGQVCGSTQPPLSHLPRAPEWHV